MSNTVKNKRTYSCPKCSYTTTHGPDLKRHAVRHQPRLPCTESTSSKRPLVYELAMKVLDGFAPQAKRLALDFAEGNAPDSTTAENHFQTLCPVPSCGYKSKHSELLLVHIASHGSNGIMKCPLCIFQTKVTRNMWDHMKRHNRAFLSASGSAKRSRVKRSRVKRAKASDAVHNKRKTPKQQMYIVYDDEEEEKEEEEATKDVGCDTVILPPMSLPLTIYAETMYTKELVLGVNLPGDCSKQ